MIDPNREPKEYFIFSKDITWNEEEEVEFLEFFDISTKDSFIYVFKNGKIYICIKPSHPGSVFFGNSVIEEPSFLIVQEIDPIIIMIGILHVAARVDTRKYSSMDLQAVKFKYLEILENHLDDYSLQQEALESSSNFLNKLFNEHAIESNLSQICETIQSKLDLYFVDQISNTIHYKLVISKVLQFLNDKITSLKNADLKNCCSILSKMLPNEISKELLLFKQVRLDYPSEETNEKDTLKRKNESKAGEYSYKKKKDSDGKKKQEKEISKNQTNLTNYFLKK